MITTIEEIYAAINPMPAMLSAKGKVKPEAHFQINANARVGIYLSWVKDGASNDWDRDFKYFIVETFDEALSEALAFIRDMPDAKTARLQRFMNQLGKVIDFGRDVGVDVDFINPLTETMKRLSENIITYQPSKRKAASKSEVDHG